MQETIISHRRGDGGAVILLAHNSQPLMMMVLGIRLSSVRNEGMVERGDKS